jgi:hypothetical protein
MNVILIVIIVFLLIRTITLKLTLGAIKVYLKEIGRYPTSEEIDTCSKKYLKQMLKKS